MFFCQNAGAKAAGTGLEVSAVIAKIHVPQAVAVSHQRDAVGQVQVDVVDFKPAVINPNGDSPFPFAFAMYCPARMRDVRLNADLNLGGTNYKGNIIFAGEGMGADIAPALYLANPIPPYNTTRRYFVLPVPSTPYLDTLRLMFCSF